MNSLAKILEIMGVGPKTSLVASVMFLSVLVAIGAINVGNKLAKVISLVSISVEQANINKQNQETAIAAIIDMSMVIDKYIENSKVIYKNPSNKEAVALAEKNIDEIAKTYLPHNTLAKDSAGIYRKMKIGIKPMK
jgi:hypothetical protein